MTSIQNRHLSPFVWIPLTLGVWLLYLLGNLPAVIYPDGITQWTQIVTGHYDDWHPITHTLAMKLATLIYPSPLMPALGQLFMMVAALGYVLRTLRELGLSVRGQFWVVLSYALVPSYGAQLCYLAKDIPFTICCLVLTCSLARLSLWGNGPSATKLDWLVLASSALGLCLLRHNGPACVIVAAGVLYWILREDPSRRRLLVSLASVGTLLFIVKLLSWVVIAAPAPRMTELLAVPLQQISAVVTKEGVLTPEQKELIAEVVPLATIKQHYHPMSVDSLKFRSDFRGELINRQPGKYFRLWVDVCMANPLITLKAWMHQTQILWLPRFDAYSTFPRGIWPNELGLTPLWQDSPLARVVHWLYGVCEGPAFAWMFRPFLANAVLLLLSIACWRKGGIRLFVAFVPCFANLGVLVFLMPTAEYRYFLPVLFALPFFAALTVLAFNQKNEPKKRG